MGGLGRKTMVLLAATALALAGAACGGSDSDDADGEDGGAQSAAAMPRGLSYDEGSGESGGAGGDVGGSAALGIGNSVIKTARLDLEVEQDGFQEAYRGVLAIADSTGGFVLSSHVEGEDSRSGSLRIRVPAESFENAMADLNDLGKVVATRVTGEDVSQEFIDLEARVRNFEAQEAVILRLMGRARSIPTSIRVQNELSRIQLEIEQLRGRLRFLEDQTEFGTITVGLRESGVAAPADESDLARAWNLAKDTVTGIASATLFGLAVVVPVGALLIVLLLLVRWARPRFGS